MSKNLVLCVMCCFFLLVMEPYPASGKNPDTGHTFTNSLGMHFVNIPAGTFTMGSSKDEPGRESDETQHKVTLTKGYYMQTTEITQGQWKAVMGNNPSHFSNCGDACPVESVSWNDIQIFITQLNQKGEGTYALPTEAQWEYAARAGSATAFANGKITHTGNVYDPVLYAMGWYFNNSAGSPHPVAQKQPNAWGLYDMHGNVWEWCADWFGETYPTKPVIDPQGLPSGSNRVMRGGSWYDYVQHCRTSFRGGDSPDRSDFIIGFRLVFSPGQPADD